MTLSPPTQGCTSNFMAQVTETMPIPAPNTFEAETRVAFDPRPGQDTVYVTTIQSTLLTDNQITANCLIAKHVAVFKKSSSTGGKFVQMTGLPAPPVNEWATDPDLAVGPDGTLYFVFLRWTSANACKPADGSLTTVELWFASPNETVLHPGLPDNLPPNGPDTAFPKPSPTIINATVQADHPLIAVNPAHAGQVVVYVKSDKINDFIATFQQPAQGQMLTPSANQLDLGAEGLFANPAFDASGNLYLAFGFDGRGSPGGPHVVSIRKLTLDAASSTWKQSGVDGLPPFVGGSRYAFGDPSNTQLTIQSTPVAAFLGDPTPGFAVATLGSSTDPIVFVAFEVIDGTGKRRIQVAAANGADANLWATQAGWVAPDPLAVPANGLFAFHVRLGVNGSNNILDLLYADVEGAQNAALTSLAHKSFVQRFDASHLASVFGPVTVDVAAPALSDLPHRPNVNDPTQTNLLFPGDYLGIETRDTTALVSFPELQTTSGPANVDLGFAQVGSACGSALTLQDPDALWECQCVCGGSESIFPIVGCASGSFESTTSACQQVCGGASVCGEALSCGVPVCNGSAVDGRELSSGSCALSDGAPPTAPSASFADFNVADAGASNAIIKLAGQPPVSTPVPGNVYISASTSPPRAGAFAEIARLDIHPADVFVGGSVGATITNIVVAHPARLRGTFTDATHFTLPAGAVEMIVTLQTQGSEGPPSEPVNVRGSNPTPMTGSLDLVHGTFSLDGAALDGGGNSLELHFAGTVVARPTDANHNGIIDTVDQCPQEGFGPDLIAPKFTFVPPAITITSCTGANIGRATATDPCGVTITNDAPARFPLGTTTVRWIATDGAGNKAVATQAVTAVLGDNTSCCPAGSHIIIGTSNNDVIVGTPGPDCILGLGGQDTISGGGGDDVISGGDGDDVINGQDGNDRLYGGSGQDRISGGNGNDFIDGGDGVDTLNGDAGDDMIFGGQGGDIIHGGIGNDFIDGGDDDDELHGDDGNDRLVGGAGNDRLFGEAGNDSLSGGDGDDRLDGGTGSNVLAGGLGHNVCIDNGVTLNMCPDQENDSF